MCLGGNLCSMQVISGTWWDRIILWLWLASTISMLWKSATCKSSLLLLNHHSDVYYRCHSEYHFSSACTVAYYLSHMSSSSKRKFEITFALFAGKEKDSILHWGRRIFCQIGLNHAENGTQNNVFKSICINHAENGTQNNVFKSICMNDTIWYM